MKEFNKFVKHAMFPATIGKSLIRRLKLKKSILVCW